MSDTIYSYYNVNVDPKIAVVLGLIDVKDLSRKNNIIGRFCIQIDRPPRGSVGASKYRVSYSFCSPNDPFSKKIARGICESRMRSGCYLTIDSDRPLSARELSEQALNALLSSCTGNKSKAASSDASHPVKIPNWVSMSVVGIAPSNYRKIQSTGTNG